MEWKIELIPTIRGDMVRMIVNGEAIGYSHEPVYAAARWLLRNGKASPEDLLTTYRGETPCMTGIVGQLATQTVQDTPEGIRKRTFRDRTPGQGVADSKIEEES